MRKLLVFLSILGMTSAASAIPYFAVDAADQKDHYQPSDWITINLVDDGPVIFFAVDAIIDNGAGGIAGEPQVINLPFKVPGALNSNGMLVEYTWAMSDMEPWPIYGIQYSFAYHIPQVTESTIISISTYADGGDYWLPEIAYYGGDYYEGHIYMAAGEEIHVVPEPATIALLGLGGLLLRRRK